MSLYTRRQSKRLTWGDFSSELPSTYFVFSSASFLPLTVYCPSMQFFLFPHDSENQCTFCLYFLLSFPHKVRQCLVTIDSGGFGKIKEPEKNPVLSLEMYVSLPSLFFSFSFSLHPLSPSSLFILFLSRSRNIGFVFIVSIVLFGWRRELSLLFSLSQKREQRGEIYFEWQTKRWEDDLRGKEQHEWEEKRKRWERDGEDTTEGSLHPNKDLKWSPAERT